MVRAELYAHSVLFFLIHITYLSSLLLISSKAGCVLLGLAIALNSILAMAFVKINLDKYCLTLQERGNVYVGL